MQVDIIQLKQTEGNLAKWLVHLTFNQFMPVRREFQTSSKSPVDSLSKYFYPYCLVLVGSRNVSFSLNPLELVLCHSLGSAQICAFYENEEHT